MTMVAPLCGSEALSQNFQVTHFIAFYIPVYTFSGAFCQNVCGPVTMAAAPVRL